MQISVPCRSDGSIMLSHGSHGYNVHLRPTLQWIYFPWPCCWSLFRAAEQRWSAAVLILTESFDFSIADNWPPRVLKGLFWILWNLQEAKSCSVRDLWRHLKRSSWQTVSRVSGGVLICDMKLLASHVYFILSDIIRWCSTRLRLGSFNYRELSLRWLCGSAAWWWLQVTGWWIVCLHIREILLNEVLSIVERFSTL